MHTSPTASLGQKTNGGLNLYVREVCRTLSERGIATDIFTTVQSPTAPTVEQLADHSRVIYLPAGRGLDKYELFTEVPAFAARIAAFAEREGIDYDVLYSHYWLSGEVACLLRPQLAAAWAHTAHTLGLVKNRRLAAGAKPEPELRIRVEGEIAQQADLLIASTADEGDDLVNLYGAPRDRIQVIAPGVDLRVFLPMNRKEARRKIGQAGGKLLLFVGRLERLKGVDLAIRALALLADRRNTDVRLMVLGEDSRDDRSGESNGSEKDRLKALATELGVRERITFAGSVAHDELPAYYSAADVLVMPSYSESFGLVGLEAQACGCPVVGSDVSGLRSVVRDDVTGYLVPDADPAIYAERIGRLLADEDLAEQMGRRGRLLAQRFTWGRTVDRLEVELEELAASAQDRVHAGFVQE